MTLRGERTIAFSTPKRRTFVDGMRSVIRIPRVQVTVPEYMFGELPVMLGVYATCMSAFHDRRSD